MLKTQVRFPVREEPPRSAGQLKPIGHNHNSRAHRPQPLSPGANREMEQLWKMQNDLRTFIVNKNEVDHKITSTIARLYTCQPQRSEAGASATSEACALRTRALQQEKSPQ